MQIAAYLLHPEVSSGNIISRVCIFLHIVICTMKMGLEFFDLFQFLEADKKTSKLELISILNACVLSSVFSFTQC